MKSIISTNISQRINDWIYLTRQEKTIHNPRLIKLLHINSNKHSNTSKANLIRRPAKLRHGKE